MTLKTTWVSGDSFGAGDANAVAIVANGAEQVSNKGVANGYAGLDSNGRVPVAQLPNSIMEYKGTYDASTAPYGYPALNDGTGNTGDVYRVTVAGSRNLGSGSIDFQVGDYAIYNGSTWEKADTTDAVATVAGRTGNVTLSASDVSGAVASGGALGTPTSGTLTNCTGLPLAGLASAAYASAATASTLAQRDANGNLLAGNFVPSVSSTATAAGTTTLTVASSQTQVFTGTSTQTVLLPTTSVVAGQSFTVINSSTGAVAVQSSNTASVASVAGGSWAVFYALVSTPTSAAHWGVKTGVGGPLGTPSSGVVSNCTGQVADMSIVAFGANTARAASSYGDFPFGVQVQRPITLTSVTFRAATADASGNLVVELRKNGSQISGTSTTIAYGSQVTGGTSTGSWALTTGDILTVYVTGVGTTPGKGLIADIKGVTA